MLFDIYGWLCLCLWMVYGSDLYRCLQIMIPCLVLFVSVSLSICLPASLSFIFFSLSSYMDTIIFYIPKYDSLYFVSISLYVYLYICLSARLPISISAYVSDRLFVYSYGTYAHSVCLVVYISAYRSIYIYICHTLQEFELLNSMNC